MWRCPGFLGNARLSTFPFTPPQYNSLALILWFGVAPLLFAVYRRAPEKYGLLPDGRVRSIARADSAEALPSESAEALSPLERSWTRAEALRTKEFWAVNMTCLSLALTMTAIWFWIADILEESGRKSTAEALAPVYAVATVVGLSSRLAGGFLIDRFRPNLLLAASASFVGTAQVVLLLLRPLQGGAFVVATFGIFLAIGSGLFMTASSVVNADYYGREHLGAISGVGTALVVLGSALGPFPFGLIKDTTGDFKLALVLGALSNFGMAVVVYILGGRPAPKQLPDVYVELIESG